MNAMEGRTREALHRVADGLVVSEHDLDRMEGNLMTLLDSRPTDARTAPRRQRDWVVAAVAAVALVVGGVALWQANSHPQAPPAGRLAPSQPLVPPELVGLWQNQPESPWLWEFASDGRFWNVESATEYVRASGVPGDSPERVTRRDGDLYTMTESGSPSSPGTGCTQTRIQVVGDTFILKDPCGNGAEPPLRLERVSPRSAAAPALKPRFPTDVERTVTMTIQIEGSWLHPATNLLLVVGQPALDDGLTYVLDDDGDGLSRPDQRGVLSVSPDGTVALQPQTIGGGCALAFSKAISNTATLVTTSSVNGCFPAGSTQTWLRLN